MSGPIEVTGVTWACSIPRELEVCPLCGTPATLCVHKPGEIYKVECDNPGCECRGPDNLDWVRACDEWDRAARRIAYA